ncbi:putative Acyl-CoA N-acyltransferase [Vibrio nigripulchritudo MADA3029]|uniref:GNAT family N-acetyltransferase n=1 Tax=Vibrio nigripulchritudo TaxID=28173 RepID=UPI0003B1F959|nr:GNAT family N-acetyltransferase [Vibrio nigripulchritudo]CCN46170.1 putative Acyl-CoA N-acyltransferase [Vibrio nigripulchritudo MADA3020]CCN51116.1 putative Acyl-CoA N-acyltransferase [Vibrio nigripulchritudo MADA3021]CCN56911.1 putative Acyl-CoA N-acyltransferase [Vibrio nigripulchritudo MADA3029]
MKLEKVNRENLREVLNLELADSQQGIVSSNAVSMAQAGLHPYYQPRAIVVDNQIVGFIMYSEWRDAAWAKEEKLGEFYIFRVMVDKEHQGKGYARQAMKATIEEIKQQGASTIHIGYSESNNAAQGLYKSLGFVETGIGEWGDMMAELKF